LMRIRHNQRSKDVESFLPSEKSLGGAFVEL